MNVGNNFNPLPCRQLFVAEGTIDIRVCLRNLLIDDNGLVGLLLRAKLRGSGIRLGNRLFGGRHALVDVLVDLNRLSLLRRRSHREIVSRASRLIHVVTSCWHLGCGLSTCAGRHA